MTARLTHPAPVWRGVFAAAATAAVWIILAVVSGLIFHFMPAAPALVGAWTYRAAGGQGRLRDGALLAAAGASLSMLGAAVLATSGRPLDDGWFTALATLVGAAAAVGIATVRPTRSPNG